MMFKHMLCVSDLSSTSRNAEYAAVKFASLFGAKLTVLSCGKYYFHVPNNYFDENVIQPIDDALHNDSYAKHLDQKRKETEDHFSALQKELNLNLGENICYEIKLENEVTATLDFLDEKGSDFDLIVVGKQNNSHWERLLFGSPGKEICDETKIPTLLMPCGDEWKNWTPTGVLVCSALSGEKENAELLGAHIANTFAAELTLMHVIDENLIQFANNFTHIIPIDFVPRQGSEKEVEETKKEAKSKIDSIIKDLKQTTPLQEIKTHIEIGLVSESVMNYLQSMPKNNLLIIGSRGENALKRFFLGSNTDAIEEACRIPICIVFYQDL
ncbi:MAG: universal stress protein [Bdellovibrionota bacterium]